MSFHQPVTPQLSVEALVNWLRKQPPMGGYAYQDPVFCLLGLYFDDNGAADAISESAYEQFPQYRTIAAPKPHTFRAALARAEQLLALPAPTSAPTEEHLPHAYQDQKEPIVIEGQAHPVSEAEAR